MLGKGQTEMLEDLLRAGLLLRVQVLIPDERRVTQDAVEFRGV